MKALLFLVLATATFAAEPAAAPCVFCEIIAGRAPGTIVCRDEAVLAFLSHSPRNPGHVLIIPIQHADNYLEVPPATLGRMMALAQKIGVALRRTDLQAEGIQLLMNTGKAAGQSVFHAHLHVIPRFAAEPPQKPGEREIVPPEQLELVAAKIRAALAQ